MARVQHCIAPLLVIACALACHAPQAKPKDDLDAQVALAFEANGRGEFESAAHTADLVLGVAHGRSPRSALVRFGAAMVAAEAHVRAAENHVGGDELAHWIAATRYFQLARDAATQARKASGGQQVEDALRRADLEELAIHARLGFTASANAFLERSPQLLTAAACQQALGATTSAGQGAMSSAPWIHLALFDFLRTRDELEAYRFGVLAIDRSAAAHDALDAHRLEAIDEWIRTGSTFEFHCPKCDLEVTPSLHACANDQTPNLEFIARPRR